MIRKISYISPESLEGLLDAEYTIELIGIFENLDGISDRNIAVDYKYIPDDGESEFNGKIFVNAFEVPEASVIEFDGTELEEMSVKIVSDDPVNPGVFEIHFYSLFTSGNDTVSNFEKVLYLEYRPSAEVFVVINDENIPFTAGDVLKTEYADDKTITFAFGIDESLFDDPPNGFISISINGGRWINIPEPYEFEFVDFVNLFNPGKNVIRIVPIAVGLFDGEDKVIEGSERRIEVFFTTSPVIPELTVDVDAFTAITHTIMITPSVEYDHLFVPGTTFTVTGSGEAGNNGDYTVSLYYNMTGAIIVDHTVKPVSADESPSTGVISSIVAGT